MNPTEIAAYYFPNWHPNPRNDKIYGPGESEWVKVREAQPRFSGHNQPKVPLWGYDDESDPARMALRIAAAADHGITAFIFDWYWNEQGPYLERALEQGYLRAENQNRLKLGIMWANHQPVSRTTFDRAVDHAIETYFGIPAYWRIDGCPYFSIYELHTLIAGLGGIDATRAALDAMRERVVRAGFPDLHLNAVEWGLHNLPANTLAPALGLAPEKAFGVQNTLIERFGISSVTSYVWVHNVDLPQFPENAYADVAEAAYADWDRFHESYPVPYHPNVTMGWDAWPRVPQSQPFEPAQYPRTPLITKNPPEAFRAALAQAKDWFATREVTQRVLTLNAWNEWTEGSYLEPDTEFGFGYLEAIRDVFGRS